MALAITKGENKVSTTKTVTVGESVAVINEIAYELTAMGENWQDYCVEDFIFNLADYGVQNNLQVRDYLLGLPIQYGLENSLNIIQFFIDNTNNPVPYLSVLGAFNYELTNHDTARELINQALALDPNYALAGLINRVIIAGWPSAQFSIMRENCHPGVMENINNSLNESVVE